MADKNHKYATRMLHHHGFMTRSDVTDRFVGHDKIGDIGRADIFCARQGFAFNVEVKYAKSSFSFAQWHDAQRRYAHLSEKDPFRVPYIFFLTVGKDRPNYNPEKFQPRKSWLIPLSKMLEVIARVGVHQLSIPYQIATNSKTVLKENHYDCISQFKDYELVWNANDTLERPKWDNKDDNYGGFWTIPDTHVLEPVLIGMDLSRFPFANAKEWAKFREYEKKYEKQNVGKQIKQARKSGTI